MYIANQEVVENQVPVLNQQQVPALNQQQNLGQIPHIPMANQPHGVNQFQNYNQIPIPGQNQFQNPIQGQFLNQFQGQNLNPIVMQGQFLNPMADPFSPYYLHPGENPGISLVSIQLTSQHYNVWARAMRMALKSKNKLPFIDGILPRPADNDPLFLA